MNRNTAITVGRRHDDAFGIAPSQPEKVLEVALRYRLLELSWRDDVVYGPRKFSNCLDIPNSRPWNLA